MPKSQETAKAAEISDGGMNSKTGQTQGPALVPPRRSLGHRLSRLPKQGLAIVVGIVAIVMVLSVYDYNRSVSNISTRLELTARFLAAELSGSDATGGAALLSFLVRQVPENTGIHLTSAKGELVAATGTVDTGAQEFAKELVLANAIWASAPVNGSLGEVIVAMERVPALIPFFQRTAAAVGVGILLILLAWRWGGPPSEPKQMSEPNILRIKSLIESLPSGIACWSDDGLLVSCNERYLAYLGLDAKTVTAGCDYVKTMEQITDDTDRLVVREKDGARLTEIERADGTCILMDERPLSVGGFMTLVTDISAQRQAERRFDDMRQTQRTTAQQLREEKIKAEAASRSKTSFLAHLSHDVRTPLNHIIGFADLIAHQTYGPVGDKRYLNYIKDIRDSGQKLLGSFAEILELAQLEGGHLVLRRENVPIKEIINSTANRFQSNAERAGIDLIATAPSEVMLFADRICLERMLGNLVENAIRFTPHGGQVKLVAWAADDGVVVEVSDTGIGISGDRLEDLSQPFVLGDAAFTKEGDGVGLGIAISRAIAELSGGILAIDSSPAVGTTVAISLPLRTAKDGRSSKAA